MEGVENIEQRTPTLTYWVPMVDGVRREFDAEVTEQVPDERVAWKTVGGDVHQAGGHRPPPERDLHKGHAPA